MATVIVVAAMMARKVHLSEVNDYLGRCMYLLSVIKRVYSTLRYPACDHFSHPIRVGSLCPSNGGADSHVSVEVGEEDVDEDGAPQKIKICGASKPRCAMRDP